MSVVALGQEVFSDFRTIVINEYWINSHQESMRKHGQICRNAICFPCRVPLTHLLPSCSRASFILHGHNVKRRSAAVPERVAARTCFARAPTLCPPQQTSSDVRCSCVSDREGMEGTGHQIESDQHPLRLPLQCACAAADR